MPDQKKFLDAAGVTHLVQLLDNYPNNDILGTVISSIQEVLDTKGTYSKPATGIPASDLSEEIVSTIDSKAPAIYCEKSGAIASFDDGVGNMPLKECVVNIEPVQDLHGYDNPWPAGGGKNKFNPAEVFLISGYGTFITADVVAGQTYTASYADTATGVSYAQRFYIDGSWVSAGAAIPSTTLKVGYTFTAAEGATKYAINGYVDGANYQLELGSSATSYAPYSNICPITGWTGAKVTRTGKNLATAEQVYAGRGPNKVTEGSKTYIRFHCGGSTSFSGIKFKESTSYTISFDVKTEYSIGSLAIPSKFLCFMYTDGTKDEYTVPGTPISLTHKKFTSNSNKTVQSVNVISSEYRMYIYIDINSFQFEENTDETAYEPYARQEYSVSFPAEAGTVYGGTLDVVNGILTVDRAMVDLGTLDWTTQVVSSNNYWLISDGIMSVVKKSIDGVTLPNIICTKYIAVTPDQAYANNIGISIHQNGKILVYDPNYNQSTSAPEFKTAMSGVQLVYELATPITYTLTPQEIRVLLGMNNIWADTGDMSVEYCADTKTYVDNVPVQDVQVNGTSVVQNGVANVPVASSNDFGAVKIGDTLSVNVTNNRLNVKTSGGGVVKIGTASSSFITPEHQHESTFYGLAKAAGDSTQSASDNAVGIYTDKAKGAIQRMLGIDTTLAPTEASSTASAVHAVGSYFIYDSMLYRTTSEIAQGGIITPNTNCVAVTVGEELVTLDGELVTLDGKIDNLKTATHDSDRRIIETDLSPWEDGKYVYQNSGGSGIGTDSPERSISNYVRCFPGQTITYKAETDHTIILGISFWDENKGFVPGVKNNGSYAEEHTVTVPENAYYFVLTTNSTKIPKEQCYAVLSPNYYDYLKQTVDKTAGNTKLRWLKGKYINASGGFSNDTSRYISYPIECVPGQVIRYKAETNKNGVLAIAFYDANEKLIVGYGNIGSYANEYTAIVPDMAVTFRIGANDASIPPAQCCAVSGGDYVQALSILASERIYYVSTSGDDTANSGKNENKPFRTINKAIEAGATTIIIYPGTYAESIIVSHGDRKLEELNIYNQIYPYSSGQNMPKVILSSAAALTFASGAEEVMECAVSYDNNSMLYKCFVSQTENIVDTTNPRSTGYKCNLWDGETKLTPVLSLALCKTTANSWYFDGTKIYANTSSTALVLDDGDNSSRISINGVTKVRMCGVAVNYGTGGNSFAFEKCNGVELTECEANYNGLANGFYAKRANVTYNNCSARYNRNDGFNYDDNGYTQFFNCEAIHNYDDGISHHGACTGFISGGEVAYNGKGGIAPVYLAVVNIEGVYSHHNTYGLLMDGSGNERVFNSVFIDNGLDLKIDGKNTVMYGCKYGSKTVASGAVLDEIQ